MKLFALALSASRPMQYTIEHSQAAACCLAENKEEAIGHGIETAKKNWPNADGWANHQCAVVEMPTKLIKKVLEKL